MRILWPCALNNFKVNAIVLEVEEKNPTRLDIISILKKYIFLESLISNE